MCCAKEQQLVKAKPRHIAKVAGNMKGKLQQRLSQRKQQKVQ